VTTYHETAHYMTHMLMTDAQWRAIQQNAPQNHGISDVFTRTSAIPDDYAYYLQWVMGWPSTNPLDASTLVTSKVRPELVDMPAVEGFAATLMGYLTQTQTPRRDFDKGMSEIPALGATPGEVAALISSGALHINALTPVLENFVVGRKLPKEALAVLAERCGWSYHLSGQVLYGGQPAVNATIQSVIRYRTGATGPGGITHTYTTPLATVDAQGNYRLPRAFYGNMQLQVTYKNVTTNIPYTIDRSTATSTTITPQPIELNRDVTSVLNPLTPDTVMPGQTITLTGSGFGATQPLGSSVDFYLLGNGVTTVPGTVVSWSDTAIKVIVPDTATCPMKAYIRYIGKTSNAIWLYGGDGQAYLDALKTYDALFIGKVHRTIPGFNVTGADEEIALERLSAYTSSSWTWPNIARHLTWNGAKFTGTLNADGTWTDYGYCKETLTISGTVDPIRRRLVSLKANLYEEDNTANEFVTISLELKNINGGPTGAQEVFFGHSHWTDAGYPAVPPGMDNVVDYHYRMQQRQQVNGVTQLVTVEEHTKAEYVQQGFIYVTFRKP
jgi:hypothetical protein